MTYEKIGETLICIILIVIAFRTLGWYAIIQKNNEQIKKKVNKKEAFKYYGNPSKQDIVDMIIQKDKRS